MAGQRGKLHLSLTSGWWRQVSLRTLPRDLAAGLLGAVLVLPQAIAFATLAGLPPEYGIYSSIVPTVVAAVFGSSLHVVSGPTNANSLALFAALAPLAAPFSTDFITLALALTIMVGVIQFTAGAFRLGVLADFISPSVLLGFTSGAAFLIALYALRDFLAIPGEQAGGPLGAVMAVATHWSAISFGAVAVGLTTFVVTGLLHKLVPRAPFMLLGLAAGFGAAAILETKFGMTVPLVGDIPSTVPGFTPPLVSYADFVQLLPIAPALAVIALGQSLSIAKTVASRSGQRLDVNREFVGQGLSNIAGGFFSAYLSCGSLNRSMPNFQAGAQTPLASVFAAGFVLMLVAATASMLARIPSPAVAALLLYTAWGLLDLKQLRNLARKHRLEFGISAATFLSMLVLPFHVAIGIGMALSLGVYLRRTASPGMHTLVPDSCSKVRTFRPVDEFSESPPECPQLKLLRMEGSVYYAAARSVSDRLRAMLQAAPEQKYLLVMAKSMNFVDLAGEDVWREEMRSRRHMGGDIFFHRPRRRVMEQWQKTGFIEELGPDHIFNSKAEAVSTIYRRLDRDVCARCTARVFLECRRAAEGQEMLARPD